MPTVSRNITLDSIESIIWKGGLKLAYIYIQEPYWFVKTKLKDIINDDINKKFLFKLYWI